LCSVWILPFDRIIFPKVIIPEYSISYPNTQSIIRTSDRISDYSIDYLNIKSIIRIFDRTSMYSNEYPNIRSILRIFDQSYEYSINYPNKVLTHRVRIIDISLYPVFQLDCNHQTAGVVNYNSSCSIEEIVDISVLLVDFTTLCFFQMFFLIS